MKTDRKSRYRAIGVTLVAVLFAAGWLLRGPVSGLIEKLPAFDSFPALVSGCRSLGVMLWSAAGCACAVFLMAWCLRHKFYWGVRYAFRHAGLVRGIEQALLEAGTGFAVGDDGKYITLPVILVKLSKDLSGGTIKIRNHLKIQSKLESADLSSALGQYRAELSYFSDDVNWYIVEFEDANTDKQLKFTSAADLAAHVRQYGDYILALDTKHRVPLSSMLLVGATGSGKSYGLYSLIIEAKSWNVKPHLYFCDPKNSSLVVLGNKIDLEHSGGTVEDIIGLLEMFYQKLEQRQEELKKKLGEKLDADYRNWKLPAEIFILDEFAAFMSVVQTMDKATRDKVNMYLRNIVLKGRQLGCFLWIVMQKSDSTDIPTAIRDNLPLKICLGTATNTTYMTIFEKAADLPKRKFGPGQGLFFCQGLTRQPEIVSFPTLRFDILAEIEKL